MANHISECCCASYSSTSLGINALVVVSDVIVGIVGGGVDSALLPVCEITINPNRRLYRVRLISYYDFQ
jgi:hypothetical protein